MSLLSCVDSEILRYGSQVTIISGEEQVQTRAFVEPLRYRNKIYIGGEYRPLGVAIREKYLYIGRSAYRLQENRSVVEAHGERYLVKRSETFFIRDLPVYEWAIMVPYGAEREDDYDADS